MSIMCSYIMVLMAGAAIRKAAPSITFQCRKMEWGAPSFPRELRATSQITVYLLQQQRYCTRSSNERQPRNLLALKGDFRNLIFVLTCCTVPPKTVLNMTFSAGYTSPDKLQKDQFVPIRLHFINTQDEVHSSKQWAQVGMPHCQGLRQSKSAALP